MAVHAQRPHGAREHGGALLRDTGRRPPSLAVMEAGSPLGMPPAVTRATPPNGTADPARCRRPLKGAAGGGGTGPAPWRCGQPWTAGAPLTTSRLAPQPWALAARGRVNERPPPAPGLRSAPLA
jgi:hypothetical protein